MDTNSAVCYSEKGRECV